ncbi:MAG: hypothetical protein ABII12_04850 [Planctomycetota bacterium]
MRAHHNRRRSLFAACNLMLAGLLGVGCQSSAKQVETSGTSSADAQAFCISINRDNNGAAATGARDGTAKPKPLPRTLSFEMVGSASLSDAGASQKERAAATQAAIIDAFCRALIEARRGRGQTGSDFTAELGPRLIVQHRSLDDGYEVRVCLTTEGIQKEFVVRDGALQHEPHELGLINQLFEETRGEFSLLGTDWQPTHGECVATVGCYLPEGFDAKVAFDEPNGNTANVEAAP